MTDKEYRSERIDVKASGFPVLGPGKDEHVYQCGDVWFVRMPILAKEVD